LINGFAKDAVVYHTGGAVGGSSILLMLPNEEIVVAIILNIQKVSGIVNTALHIAKTFEAQKQQRFV